MDDEAADFGESARKAILSFTDDKRVEKKWLPGNPRTATAKFWEFVGDRSAADNEVFTIEDEEMGEGVQLRFYADSIARITTVHEGEGGSDPGERGTRQASKNGEQRAALRRGRTRPNPAVLCRCPGDAMPF